MVKHKTRNPAPLQVRQRPLAAVPCTPRKRPASEKKPDLMGELIETLETVAIAAKEAHAFGTPYQALKVQVQFGFKGSVVGGFGVPGEVVTVGIDGRYDRSTIQTVTLTFTSR